MHFLKNQKGMAGVFFALLMGSGFFLIILGLVFDGGNILIERKVHQSFADSSLARLNYECTKNKTSSSPCNSEAAATTLLNNLKSSLSENSKTQIIEVCGSLINKSGGGVPCDPIKESVTTCSPIPSQFLKSYIRVRTGQPNVGDNKQPYKILDAFPSMSAGYRTTACAQSALYGANAAKVGIALSVGLSTCLTTSDFTTVNIETIFLENDPTAYCNVGATSLYSLKGMAVVALNDRSTNPYCNSGSTDAVLKIGDRVERIASSNGDLCGNAIKNGDALLKSYLGKTVYLPTLGNLPSPSNPDGQFLTGSNGNYQFVIQGFVAFKLLAYKLPQVEGIASSADLATYGTTVTAVNNMFDSNSCKTANSAPCLIGIYEEGTIGALVPLTPGMKIPETGLETIYPLY